MLELTEEQVAALEQQQEPLKLVNPRTKEVFVLIRQEIHELTGKILKAWDDPEDDDLIAPLKLGDVVQVSWPNTDQTGSKIRLAVVVQADFLEPLTEDCVLVRIRGKSHGIVGTEVVLDPAQEPLSGLTKKCFAACSQIITFHENIIQKKIGVLSDATMQEIDEGLKSALGLL